MTTQADSFADGCEAAYAEIYKTLADKRHVSACGECRPCGVAKQAVETLMECLAGRMSADDFFDLALILARTNSTIVDAEGHVIIDWSDNSKWKLFRTK